MTTTEEQATTTPSQESETAHQQPAESTPETQETTKSPVTEQTQPEGQETLQNEISLERRDASMPLYADYDVERSVLASILTDSSTLRSVVPLIGNVKLQTATTTKSKKSKFDKENDNGMQRVAQMFFKDPKHAIVYQSILEVANENPNAVDLLTVANKLQKNNKLEIIGGLDYLAELQASCPTSVNIEGWCSILRECGMLREIIRACSNALDICKNPSQDVKGTLETIESNLFSVRNAFTTTDIKPFYDLLIETFKNLCDIAKGERESGLQTGYPDLDRLSGGLKRQEMFVLAARPSIGKTAFALNIVRYIMMKEVPNVPRKKVAFFSLEMSAEQVTQRLLCAESGIPLSQIMSKQMQNADCTRLMKAAQDLGRAELYIDPTGGLSVFELRAKARKLIDTHGGLDLIVIDYLTLMRAEVKASDGRQVEVAAISGGLKKIAKDLNVPVLVLAQLNREAEQAKQKPKLSNLRESGAIEQDADIVCFLHRDRDETKESSTEANTEGVDAEVIVEKNRNGATGVVKLKFIPKLMQFITPAHKYEKKDTATEK